MEEWEREIDKALAEVNESGGGSSAAFVCSVNTLGSNPQGGGNGGG